MTDKLRTYLIHTFIKFDDFFSQWEKELAGHSKTKSDSLI